MRLRNLVIALILVLVATVPAFASHGWGSYHWGKSCATCAVSLNVYNSTVTTNTSWATHLNRALYGDSTNPNTTDQRGWDASIALTLSNPAGATDASTRSACPAVSGAIRVCNYTYGSNGWLGLASINTVSGSTVHIAWGTVKVNDTYFNTGSYPNTEKRHVMCQEVGHTFGLGHTSENGSSQNTCMDYYQNTSSSDWTSTGPNQHDFDQILTQMHWGSKTYLPAEGLQVTGDELPNDFNAQWQWGTPAGFDNEGRPNLFKLDLGEDAFGNEHAIWTRVIWADSSDRDRAPRTPRSE